ncbi:MAG TPA: flagellar basal-body MS-ring/collar protein FliF [Solirubrobacteraceae bacterium]|nr:flagellar basal-body MS-ring/collar protein FliF [Solirubrobacteraceae bacterium]
MPIAQLVSRLTPRGWMIAGGGAAAVLIFLYLFMHLVSQPSYSTLMSGIDPSRTGKMTSTLDQQGIGYQLQNNGTALAVQSNKTAQARVALAGAGLLGSSNPDFSLFDKQSLGASNFQQQVTYQRALQGQLAGTINNIQGVSGAQVELVLPDAQSQLFASDKTSATAAVLLSGTSSLDPGAVRGIAQLVASSVPSLQLSKVTITDGSGQLLWPTDSAGGAGGTGLSKQDAESRYDQSMQANLNAMLVQSLGPDKAQVQVNADMNVDQTTQETLTYGKAGVPLQQSKDSETLAGNGSSGGGGATGTANIPAYAQTGSGGKSNYKHEVTNTTLGVDKTVTHSKVAPGKVTSQHVSVLLDKTVPAASVAAVKAAVASAAGIQATRGDTLSIGQIAFAKPAGASAGPAGGMLGYAKYAAIGIGSIAFLFFTTRMLRRREQEGIDHEPVWLRELEVPVRLSELERETSRPTEALAVAAGSGSPSRRQVESLVESSPDRVAQQLQSWMQEG